MNREISVRRVLHTAVNVMLVIWCVLLVPWYQVVPFAAMAADSGITTRVYVFVWSLWTYPVSVGIAFIGGVCGQNGVFGRKMLPLSLLPFLNVLGLLIHW